MVELLKKYKLTIFILGAVLSIIIGGKDTNFLGLIDLSGKQILESIEKGKLLPHEVELTEKQYQEVLKLINKKPEKYTPKQKALVSELSGEEILEKQKKENINPHTIWLNFNQHNQIKKLIDNEPEKYTEDQKILIKEPSVETILLEVGLGKRPPSSVHLNEEQKKEIEKIIVSNPSNYNDLQKELISNSKK